MSIVRDNLLNRPGYTPYCGSERCSHRMPRTTFDGSQFKCQCGWRSGFEPEFIEQYIKRWCTVTPHDGRLSPSAPGASIPAQRPRE